MKRLFTPSVPELVRFDTSSDLIAEEQLEKFFLETGGNFNYLPATKALQKAFKGYHIEQRLVEGCYKSGSKSGRTPNAEVATLAVPVAFGRVTQVFPIPKRPFKFGHNREAAFRVPFFFTEEEIVKICYLQPRKYDPFNHDQLCGLFTIYKRHLLDKEFYNERTDIEFIDVSAPEKGAKRVLSQKKLSDVKLWSDDKLVDHLTTISKVLDKLERIGLAEEIKPRRPFKDPELPLFDW
ncbi:hypothetical protein [Roseibium aggregatum]|uniref:hypothetical protein n=1 Tax=Roseibium aggregatum TaxID=187304 RepID=UPI003A96BC12